VSDIDQGSGASSAPGEAQRRERARRKVVALKGFYIHLFVFLLVNVLLVGVNVATGGPFWALWIILGWGIGVLAHALSVMGRINKAVASWEERKLKQYMAEDD
jgi:hypothetical protein